MDTYCIIASLGGQFAISFPLSFLYSKPRFVASQQEKQAGLFVLLRTLIFLK
jgi:hypothetical protein